MSVDSDREFEEFAAAGEVEIGESDAAPAEKPAEPEPKKPSRGPPKPAPAAKSAAKEGDDGGEGEEEVEKPKPKTKPAAKEGDEAGDGGEGKEDEEDEEGEEDEEEKPKKNARDQQINRLKREKAELQRELRDSRSLAARLDALEKGGLPTGKTGGKSGSEESPAPDPLDVKKYPLGHLDDRYIEDKLEWLSEQKATQRADAVLHRQQEAERADVALQAQKALLEKVEDLATRGDELYDDFQESVVDTGMRGDWDLSQPTFEAAYEVDNGAQILYELSQDKKEAKRVAKLSPYQQMKFVQDRDAEIGDKKKARKIPKAGEPPLNQARGRNSKTQINPATDNLDDFEKAWAADEKGKS